MNNFQFGDFFQQLMGDPKLRGQDEIIIQKGEHLFLQGEVCKDLFCMQRGLVKLYYNTREGKEWIKSFIADRGMIGSRASQVLDMPSPFSAVCLEKTTVIRFPYEVLEEVCFSDEELAKALFQFTQWLGLKKELREYQLLCQTAEEGYVEFKKDYPGLAERLTQIDIARYLGITPIALSRIKKRIES